MLFLCCSHDNEAVVELCTQVAQILCFPFAVDISETLLGDITRYIVNLDVTHLKMRKLSIEYIHFGVRS